MLTIDQAEALRRVWEANHRTMCQLEKELVEARERMAAVELLLAEYAPTDAVSADSTLCHAHVRPSRIAHCETQLAAFKEIAQLSGGVVRVGEASRLVHEAGLSKGKVQSISSGIRHKLDASDEWEYAAPGTYRLLTYTGLAQWATAEVVAPDANVA